MYFNAYSYALKYMLLSFPDSVGSGRLDLAICAGLHGYFQEYP